MSAGFSANVAGTAASVDIGGVIHTNFNVDGSVSAANPPAVATGNQFVTASQSKITLGTAVTASGNNVDFTGIPAWANRIVITLSGISTNGTSLPEIRLGTSSGFETTSYRGTITAVSSSSGVSALFSTGFTLTSAGSWAAAGSYSGTITLVRNQSNTWNAQGSIGSEITTAITSTISGSKTLAGVLDRIRLITVNGTDLFDAGTINISWE